MTTDTTAHIDATAQRSRRWWQTLPVLLALAAPTAVGAYASSVVGIGVLLSDSTRDDDVRGAGIALYVWWMYAWRQGDTTPYVGAVLLAIAAVLLVRAATRARIKSLLRLAALGAITTGAVGFVGYGSPRLSRADALDATLRWRAGHPWTGLRADRYLVDAGRRRFVHSPLWFVVLYERNDRTERTKDDQPCFKRREVWRVDARNGTVSRETRDESRVVDDPCLPIRLGTERDLRPVPGSP